MVKTILAIALAATAGTPSAVAKPGADRPVRAMYTDALAREQAVRPALAAPDALATIVIDVRAVVAEYEALVKRYPASGYSDDALWNAGCLSLDAFEKFGQAQDRDAAARLLKRLFAGYPASKFAKQVPEQLARMRDAGSRADVEPVAATASRTIAGIADSPKNDRAGTIVTIRDIRRTVTPQSVRVTIELDGETTFHDERIPDPDRVFVDLPLTRAAPNLLDKTLRFESDADLVRQVRLGRHPNHTTRVVLDAAGVGSYSVYPMYAPFRLVIECVKDEAPKLTGGPTDPASGFRGKEPVRLASRRLTSDWVKAFPSGSPRASMQLADVRAAIASSPTQRELLPARKPTNQWIKAFPAGSPRASARIANARAGMSDAASPEEPVPTAMTSAPTAPVAPAPAGTSGPPRAGGGVSIARQLGLGISRVVIDPGHGGHDPGAHGRGVTEAELVLDVSLRLQKLLEKTGMEVVLTRTTDDFVPLQERPAIANRENADLFLSIHANASPVGAARGVETYSLNFANNPNAAQVAARENAASALSMGTLPDMVKAIALNTKVDESRDFAAHVQHAMVDRLRTSNRTLKDLGVKQAPFIVLIGATMPSVLAEISFVTNPQEAKLLKGNPYRQKIAEALFNAIRDYQTSLKHVQTVAHQ